MPRLQLNATELIDPNVDIVSMVKRGANRIPFRVTKKDDTDMIDLSKLGASLFAKNDKPTAPAMVGAVFAKGADVENLTAMLKEAGLDLAAYVKSESDKATTLTKADAEVQEDNLVILKLDDDIALLITGPEDVIKSVALHDWDSTSFKEIMKKGTFVPSIMMAQDMLTSTFFNIMEKAENPDQLSSLMTKAAGEFSDYVGKLTKALPDSVFKAEVALAKSAKGKKDMEDDMDDEDTKEKTKKEEITDNPAINSKTSDTEAPKDGATSNDIEGTPANGNGTATNPPLTSNADGGTVSNDIENNSATDSNKTSQLGKGDPDPILAALAKLQGDMSASFEKGIGELRSHVDKSVTDMQKEVASLGSKVAKAEAAVSGTVVGDADGDNLSTSVSKSGSPKAPPLLDTSITSIAKLEREEKARLRA